MEKFKLGDKVKLYYFTAVVPANSTYPVTRVGDVKTTIGVVVEITSYTNGPTFIVADYPELGKRITVSIDWGCLELVI